MESEAADRLEQDIRRASPRHQPLYDPDRLDALRRSALMDSLPEEIFDRLTRLATRLLAAPTALISLVGDDRQYFKSHAGLREPWATRRETPLSHSFCQHVVNSGRSFVVPDAREHPLVNDNLAIEQMGTIAYAGIPLTTSDGLTLGTICVVDTKSRQWTSADIQALRDLAAIAAAEIERRLNGEERTEALRALEDSQAEALERLAQATESRDANTGLHTRRVGNLSALLAAELGWSDAQCLLMRLAAPLHDVGKIAIPDSILLKEGALTQPERVEMQKHTTMGARVLADGNSELMRMAEVIALSHHERWDGSGYPRKLKGEAIPIEGRIVAVADVYDALTHDRPYHTALPDHGVVAELRRQAGSQFDPAVVDALLRVLERPDFHDTVNS
jgi:hypothetical protein